MLLDESKMAADSSISFLNCGKQHTNLKLRTFYLRLKTKPNSPQAKSLHQNLSQSTNSDRICLSRSTNSDRTLQLHKPNTVTQSRLTAYETNFPNIRIIRILEILE